jgi:Fur family peroxide stress response transcriptional regulator
MEVQTRHSTRRDAVLECLRKHHDHPTADMLYNEIRQDYPNISLGTVYRNLNFFVEHGEAVRIPVTDGQTRFDGNVKPHFHFRCSSCGALLDLNLEDGRQLEENLNHPKTDFKGHITGYDLVFTGICGECLKREKETA